MAGQDKFSDKEIVNADINSDGGIAVDDAIGLQMFLVGYAVKLS